jgi:hypothetical protein
MRWAVDEILLYRAPGATVPDAGPLPRWGWDGLVR